MFSCSLNVSTSKKLHTKCKLHLFNYISNLPFAFPNNEGDFETDFLFGEFLIDGELEK